MVATNPDEESNSDGLEILSVGTLYNGSFDKKYWSSSRGKDRYPYPVGYQGVRTFNGLTYKMEIYEGPKGPIFQITSNNKQSSSGDTPDRAWEVFQKKCSFRIKLWHGRSFSGKVDGIEFFGFKNALVQRLLRELVASVNDAAEHSSPCNSFNDASAKSLDKCPDLMPHLKKNRVTGKRSRIQKGIDTKSACTSNLGSCQPQQKNDHTKVVHSQPQNTSDDELTISCASGEGNNVSHASGTFPATLEMDLVKNVLPSAPAYEDFADSKAKPCLAQVHKEHPSMETCTSASLVSLDIRPDKKLLERQCIEDQGCTYSVRTEKHKEEARVISDFPDSRPLVQNDSQANHFEDLCAPDTFDTQQEIASLSNSGNQHRVNTIQSNEPEAADMIMSLEPVTISHSEEGNSYLNGNSERNDFDSVGEDIAKSMMNVLLPKAVPLLTYSSRKKKRRNKPPKVFPGGQTLVKELKGTLPSDDVMFLAGALANSTLEGPKKAHVSGACIDAPISLLENMRYVVPDSLDDQFDGNVAHQVLSSTDNAETVPCDFNKGKHVRGSKESAVVVNTKEALFCPSQTNGLKEALSEVETGKQLDKRPQTCSVPAVPSIGCGSSIPLNLITPPKVDCLVADDRSKPENFSGRKELHNEGHIFISQSAKQHSMPCDVPGDLTEVVEPVIGKYSAPLSESIICRNAGDTDHSETVYSDGNLVAPDSFQLTSLDDGDSSKTLLGVEALVGGHVPLLQNRDDHEALALDSSHHVLFDQALGCALDQNSKELVGGNVNVQNSDACIHVDVSEKQHRETVAQSLDQSKDPAAIYVSNVSECQDVIHRNPLQEQKQSDVVDMPWKLIGCYSHPVQISSVILSRKAHDIYMCVSCGVLEERKRNLFLYKIDAKETSLGSPCMVAHTSMYLPILKDEFGRQVAVDKTGLQFTPDATCLVIADSVRMPYCTEKNLHCSCPECESSCYEENAIKIVQVKRGYVSVVLKLKTVYPLHCIIVCEPEHLVALDESGIIYIWIMNSTWSVQSEEYVIRSYEFLPSRIVELKRIPRSASMVIGHNGYGDLSLWDITKRTVVSRFSATTNSVLEFVPISLFSWQRKSLQSDEKPVLKECVKKLREATMLSFSDKNEANMSLEMKGEHVAVWLFISTPSDSPYPTSYHEGRDGCWRLGLLIRNKLILGAALDPSTTSIGTAAGHGMIGTDRGHVYIWDLASGTKLGTLHNSTGSEVPHIFTDDATSSTVAIARGAELSVYLRI